MRTLVPLVLLLAISFPAQASHCETWSTTTAWTAGAGAYYLSVDIPNTKCCYAVWVYEESNGIPGLQRGDEQVDDTCHGLIRPDTIIL